MAGALNVNDLVVLRSDRSGVDALKVAIHRLPANVSSAVTPAQNTYTFWYRPRTEKETRGLRSRSLVCTITTFIGERSLFRHQACRFLASGSVRRALLLTSASLLLFSRRWPKRWGSSRLSRSRIGIISLPSTSGRKPYAGFSWKRPRINAHMVRDAPAGEVFESVLADVQARAEPLGATAPWQNRSRTKKINRP